MAEKEKVMPIDKVLESQKESESELKGQNAKLGDVLARRLANVHDMSPKQRRAISRLSVNLQAEKEA